MAADGVIQLHVVVYLLLAYLTAPVTAGHGELWTSVQVSKAKLLESKPLDYETLSIPENLDISVRIFCSAFCQRKSWCDVWCYDPGSKACLLYSIIVLPGYLEDNPDDALTCYTRLKDDLALGAAVSGIREETGDKRVLENINDGLYRYFMNDCFVSGPYLNPWIKVDLWRVVLIRQIKLLLIPTIYAAAQYNYEIRTSVNDILSPADNASLDLFGSFPGPGLKNQEVVLERTSPVAARYVTIQRFVSRGECFEVPPQEISHCKMQFCHLTINE